MLQKFKNYYPVLKEPCYVHETAVIMGDVVIDEYANIWPCAVLRGDVNYIRVGKRTNIQDNTVIHTAAEYPAIIGDDVTVGHAAIIHACTIGKGVLIGMGATILDGAEIGEFSIIGANALVTKGMKIPPRSLVLGAPAKVKRELTQEEIDFLTESAKHYWELATEYKKEQNNDK